MAMHDNDFTVSEYSYTPFQLSYNRLPIFLQKNQHFRN